MGILIKRNKVIKHQEGGTIPFYTTYQAQFTGPSQYNPLVLLDKYKGQPAPKTTESKGTKKKDNPFSNLKGLRNERNILINSYQEVESQLRKGLMAMGEDFYNTPQGMELQARMDKLSALDVYTLERNEKVFDASVKEMQTNKSQKAWLYQTDKGGLVQDRTTGKYTWIDPTELNEELEDGQKRYRSVTYGEAADEKATNLSDEEFAFNEELSMRLGRGLGIEKMDDVLDKFYNDTGKTITNDRIEIGNTIVGKEMMRRIVEGSSTQSDEEQLTYALNLVVNNIQNTPLFDTMYGQAFQEGAKTHEEAWTKVKNTLKIDMAKRLNINAKNTDINIKGLGDDPSKKGSTDPTGPVEKLSIYMPAASGVIPHDFSAIEVPDEKGDRATMTHMMTWDAVNVKNNLLEPGKPLSENSMLNRVGKIEQARLPDGTPLSQNLIQIGGNSYRGLDAMIPAKSTNVKVMELPIDSKTGGVKNIPENVRMKHTDKMEELNKKKSDLEASIKEADTPGFQEVALRNVEKEIAAETTRYRKELGEGVTVQKFYVLDVLYEKDTDNKWLEHTKELQGTEKDEYTGEGAKFEDAYNTFEFVDIGKTSVLIPIRSAAELAHADDLHLKIPRERGTAGYVVRNPGNAPRTPQ